MVLHCVVGHGSEWKSMQSWSRRKPMGQCWETPQEQAEKGGDVPYRRWVRKTQEINDGERTMTLKKNTNLLSEIADV